MPSISGVGKRRPTSTTTILPPYSTTVMFLPISPRPPSGSTRSFSAAILSVPSMPRSRRELLEQAVADEHRPHRLGLDLVGLDHRQAQPADAVAEQVQRRLRAR